MLQVINTGTGDVEIKTEGDKITITLSDGIKAFIGKAEALAEHLAMALERERVLQLKQG